MVWRALAIVTTAALLASLVPALRHLRETPPPPPDAIRTSFRAEPGSDLGAGEEALDAALSGDGRHIVYVATRAGHAQLWHRALDGTRAEALAGTDAASLPAWKPGGRTIAFFADASLKWLSLADRRVAALAPASIPGGASWLPDGSLLFSGDRRGPIKVMRAGAISDATHLRPGERGHAFPIAASGGGFVYVATRMDGSRVIRLVREGQDSELTATSGHGTLVGDVLVYARDGALLAQRFDGEQRRLTGRTVAVAPAVGVSASGHGYFAAGQRLILSAAGAPASRELRWYDGSGVRQQAIAEPGDYWQVRLAPDDSQLAVTALDPLLHTLDVFIVPVATPRDATRLSLSIAADADPTWSPDGGRIAFNSAQGGTSRLLVRATPGSATDAPLAGAPPGAVASDWRGGQLLLHAPSPKTGLDLWLLDIGRQSARQITRGAFNERDARWSPDARQIAYVSDESGQPEIYVDAWPQGGSRVRVSFGGGERPQWAPAGALLFMRGSQVMRTSGLRTGGGSPAPQMVFEAPGLIDYAVAHRRAGFVVLTRAQSQSAGAEAVTDWRSLIPAPPR